MRKERNIINTNIRLNLSEEQDRRAWEYLQNMDRKKYKSYTRAVVTALNDYFEREYRLTEDPYLETREKEDLFLEKVQEAIREGVKESVPMALAKNLMELLYPFMKEVNGAGMALSQDRAAVGSEQKTWNQEQEDMADAALDFADSF